MVLTEAFAAGTPVVASDIAGYRDVVRNGVDGILVPPADATQLAETLRDLWEAPERRDADGAQRRPRRRALRLAAGRRRSARTPTRTRSRRPSRCPACRRAAVALGLRAADLKPRVPARRMPSLQPKLRTGNRAVAIARRVGLGVVTLGGAALAYLALQKIGVDNIVNALLTSSPTFVLLGLAIMCCAMAARAVSWHAILRAALPRARVRLSDAMQGTFIGVLMSSTLPARLGEPSRALVVARRTGRPRENLPVVLGTVVSQTLLNIVALIILGTVMFSSVDLFNGHQNALLFAAIAPLALLVLVLLAPVLLRHGANRSRFGRLHAVMAQLRRAMTRVRAGLAVFQRPRLGSSPPWPSSAPGPCSGCPATCCSWPWVSATRPGWPAPRRSCSRSTSPPCCRPRRPTSASFRPPARLCCTPAGTSARAPASPTA